jgi:CIC family chloride channel protein
MLGGACAALAHLPPAPFAIVGMAAVFAGAGRVPFATMMMVTEMTGGYTLLVPAAMAVMVSYLIQSLLTYRAKYRTIYEAQVGTRGDSPAHHRRHLEVALKLLRGREKPDLSGLGEVNLLSLLSAGVPVELPGDRRIIVGVLRKESPVIGSTLATGAPTLADGSVSIIAIIRNERIVAPKASTEFKAGDRMMLVTDAAHVDALREHLELGA